MKLYVKLSLSNKDIYFAVDGKYKDFAVDGKS